MTEPAASPISSGTTGGRLWAVLGPTNTGKTHLAVSRMLGYRSGIIGLPLRLLAREIYDRIVILKGARSVALVTGEEKIVPPHPQWFVCTVEAMPLERDFEFLAIDEIQLVADGERGHVFTDRLLRARGSEETLFLGSDTVRGLLRRLVPGITFESRPRFSKLSYAGTKKLSRLPRRSAIVAFSAAEVYGIAELVRRQRGGAAVVMGALSPRTRNAQVELYQSGDVDFLVATDAIGMGINMDVDHVAFAATRKFDGVSPRGLTPAEFGQIAGRAGRHMSDGTFGTTGDVGALDADLVEKLENHRFDPVNQARWRNHQLEFRSLGGLVRSLDVSPPHEALIRAREADDYLSLKSLAADGAIASRASNAGAVRLLWQVCQVPDFRKTMHEQHVRLLKDIFQHLDTEAATLPTDWVARQMTRLDRPEGDIDTLSARLAHVRTWTYIAHRAEWLKDAAHWQARARSIEDRLSDALHERLTQRFVDRRAAALVRGMANNPDLEAAVGHDGSVVVEGQYVGQLHGLLFQADASAGGDEGRMLRTAANRTLGQAIAARAAAIAKDLDDALSLDDAARLCWRGAPVAQLAPGDHVLRPRLRLIGGAELDGPARAELLGRLETWLKGVIGRALGPLLRLGEAELKGTTCGIAFQLGEALGIMPRQPVAEELRQMPQSERHELRRLGVVFGEFALFMPAVLKPEPARLKCLLWAVRNNATPQMPPPPGLTSLPAPTDRLDGWWQAAGFVWCGPRAVRLDMLERVGVAARKLQEAGGAFAPSTEMLSLLGCGHEEVKPVLRKLGYAMATTPEGERWRRKPMQKRAAPKEPEVAIDPDSPFAKLKELARR